MKRSPLFLVLGAAIASFAVACSTASPHDAASSDDALTGSLANAKACAVRDAYAAAQLSAFQTAAKTELPGVEPSASTQLSKFDVKDIGRVFVVEQGNVMAFYDAAGALLAKTTLTSGQQLVWMKSDGAPLTCTLGDDDDDDDDMTVDAGPAEPTSCLSTDPIDATQYPYTPTAPALRGKCTATELAALSSYYRANATSLDLDGWRASVGADCSACAFGDADGATWAPLLVGDDGQFAVNRGGCVEAVSGSEACGRAYQQYQDCTVDACLVNCTTQAEFTQCRQDQAVLTTSCKGALENVKSACGETNIGQYETACKGTTYTFEGPIKVMCVTGTTGPSIAP